MCARLYNPSVFQGYADYSYEIYTFLNGVQTTYASGEVEFNTNPDSENPSLVRELAAEGAIDGIEVDHPSNSPEDSAECLALCKQYGLVATAGTDFHGRNHKHPHPIGTCTAPDEAAAQLRAIAEKRKRERT